MPAGALRNSVGSKKVAARTPLRGRPARSLMLINLDVLIWFERIGSGILDFGDCCAKVPFQLYFKNRNRAARQVEEDSVTLWMTILIHPVLIFCTTTVPF